MTPSEIEASLTGNHVKLYPYDRRFFAPETLFTLWQMLKQEGADKKIFWSMQEPAEGYDVLGDLVNFTRMFAPEQPGTRHLLIAQSVKDPSQVVGMFWFDEFLPGLRANGSVFYRRRYWGAPAREASFLACRYGFDVLKIPTLWATTPWKTGYRHAESVGFQIMTSLPGFVLVAGKPTDLLVLRLRREDLREGS